eukprot:TRINITY_DN596_c0_g2_i1.p1 TRINITY_DN596_c0_g2~~TRINITY_DN596_c0_g2_i1.p1  ORF type:complete len:406 (+),score=139.94 TRINITY_DN596_c0_g2_i1:608-1825(+)
MVPDTMAPLPDECVANPCNGQSCSDPTGAATMGDFVCTCSNGQTNVGGPVTGCNDLNECLAVPAPCGATQSCNDPNPKANKKDDFVCTCPTNMNTATGAPVSPCPAPSTEAPATAAPPTMAPPTDECENFPCNGQSCVDTTGFTVADDFVCTCDEDKTSNKGAPVATCGVKDECKVKGACGVDQNCRDPDTSSTSLGDYICECMAKYEGHSTVGKPTTCTMMDECSGGTACDGQSCSDPTGMATQGDFICTCKGSNKTEVGKPVQGCDYMDECEKDPCEHGQSCTDPVTTPQSLKDFTCKCADGSGEPQVGGPVVKGCDGFAMSPLNLAAANGPEAVPEESSSSSGLPIWVYILIALGVVGACAGGAFMVLRQRKANDISFQDFVSGIDHEEGLSEMQAAEQVRV